MDTQRERDLVQTAQQGDREAFGLLAQQYTPMLRSIVWRALGESSLADDLVQEVLLQAYLSLDRLRDPAKFRSWLYGIGLNVCRNTLRTAGMNHTSLEALVGGMHREPADGAPTPEEIAERVELRRIILHAVNALSPANRDAIVLFYYQDFSLREIADALAITVTAVKGRLHKARLELHAVLSSTMPFVASDAGVASPIKQSGGNNPMIPAQVVDVIRKETPLDGAPSIVHMQAVVYAETLRRALVIWVGEFEGYAIMRALNKEETPRPMTQVFMARLLEASGAVLERIAIIALQENIYYARAFVRVGDVVREVDARPSDALALALEMNAPLFVDEQVLEKQGVAVPEGHLPSRGGVAGIKAWFDQLKPVYESHFEGLKVGKSEQELSEALTQDVRDAIAQAFRQA